MIPTPEAIEEAAGRLHGLVRQTPVLAVEVAGATVTAKLELLQHTGSFKPRGAFNRVLRARVPEAGLITASGGNHGLAVAHVARALGFPAEVFVAEVTPEAKRSRIAALGARVVIAGPLYDDALAASRRRVEETGALEVHAYDHPDVVAGQGTVGRELEAQAPDLETVLVAVGGGGLIGGVAAWYAGRARVVAVEPEGAPTLRHALDTGAPVTVDVAGVAADSLGARRIGSIPFDVARRYVSDSVLVPDEAIRRAQRLLWEEARLVAEPGGATALAALVSGVWKPEGGAVGVIVCGANTDPALMGSPERPG